MINSNYQNGAGYNNQVNHSCFVCGSESEQQEKISNDPSKIRGSSVGLINNRASGG